VLVGTERNYSNRLPGFMLRAKRPEVYGDCQQIMILLVRSIYWSIAGRGDRGYRRDFGAGAYAAVDAPNLHHFWGR
jgi:hypothetical protein